jgi:tetratricopeptide (TPR) repeat protein
MSSQRASQLVEAGLWLRLSGDHEGARRLFEQALKLDPGNARAKQLLESKPPAPAEAAVPPASSPTIPFGAANAAKLPSNPFEPPPATGPPRSSPTMVFGDDPFQPPGTPLGQGDWGAATGAEAEPLEPRASPPGRIVLTRDATSAWDHQSNPGVHIDSIRPGAGAGMDLVAAEVEKETFAKGDSDLQEEIQTLLRGAKDLLELDDHTGAMDLIAKAQELAPNDPEVLKMRERSEETLQAMFESKLGDLERVPRVKLKDDEIIWLNLDHRAGFVLAQIDGTVTYEDVFAVSGMSRLDTARILAQLMEEGVIQTG